MREGERGREKVREKKREREGERDVMEEEGLVSVTAIL